MGSQLGPSSASQCVHLRAAAVVGALVSSPVGCRLHMASVEDGGPCVPADLDVMCPWILHSPVPVGKGTGCNLLSLKAWRTQ